MADGRTGEIPSDITLTGSQGVRRNAANTGYEAFTPASGSPETDPVFVASEAHNFAAGDKTKLDGIAAGAEVNVNADWNAVAGDALVLNKPTIPTQYTDEMAQDAIGAMIDTTLTYVDATPLLSVNPANIKLDDHGTPDDNTDLNANTTNHGLVVKATAPAANILNVVGIANGETAYTNKSIFDGTNPAALGAAAPGTSLIAAHRDHVHANPALDTLAATTDITTLDATTTAHGLVVKAVAPAANILNVVGIANGEAAYTNKSIFDATNPAALGSVAPGTSLIASHRDHVHTMPTAANVAAIPTSVLAAAGDIVTASGASTPAVITAVAVGKVLHSAGVAAVPAFRFPPYNISGGSLSFAMVSSTQYYFGMAAAPTTTKGQHRIYIPYTGTMVASQVSWFRSSGSASTSWTMNYYYNGGNAVSMGAIATAANVVWQKLADTLAVTAGQYIEFGTSTPAWGANQTGLFSFWLQIVPTS